MDFPVLILGEDCLYYETDEYCLCSSKGNSCQILYFNKKTGFYTKVVNTNQFYKKYNHIELEAVKQNNVPLTFVLKFIEQEQPKRQLKQQYKQEHFKRQELVKMHYNQRQFKHRRLNQPNKFK
jgi:hypothetical protein